MPEERNTSVKTNKKKQQHTFYIYIYISSALAFSLGESAASSIDCSLKDKVN